MPIGSAMALNAPLDPGIRQCTPLDNQAMAVGG